MCKPMSQQPLEHEKNDRDAIIRSAVALMTAFPNESLSRKRIAESAGIGIATVTKHFRSLSDLLAAISASKQDVGPE